MIVANTFEDFRRLVLTPEGLDNPRRWLKAGLFDEIPLYSRYEQIEPFLRRGSSADSFLLDMALEYLAEVCAAAKSSRGFLAAITIHDDSDACCILPYIFVCRGDILRRLGKLRLRKPLTEFGKRIASLLRRADPSRELGILEDALTVPGEARIFISYPEMLDQVVRAGEAHVALRR